MIKKHNNQAAEAPPRPAAVQDVPARDRGGRMRRPAAPGTGAGLPGGPPDVSRMEKSLEALGRLLKTKREVNGLTRRDVVVKIKIPLDQLEAIEDGHLSTLPPVFAKGFLRAYANELGLDAEAILDDYRKMTGGFKNEPASREPLAPRYVETSVGSRGWRPGPRLVVLAVLVVAAVAAAFWLRPELQTALSGLWSDDETPAAAATENPPPAVQVVTAQNDPVPAEEPRRPAAEAPSPTVADQAEGAPTIGGALSRPPEAAQPTEAGGPAEGLSGEETRTAEAARPLPVLTAPASLTLTSTKNQAWAEVTVDGRAPEFFWFARAGESAKVVATESIVVASGTAKDLLVLWDGQDELGPLSQTSATTVRVRFPKY